MAKSMGFTMNLYTCTASDLTTLPGIGNVYANELLKVRATGRLLTYSLLSHITKNHVREEVWETWAKEGRISLHHPQVSDHDSPDTEYGFPLEGSRWGYSVPPPPGFNPFPPQLPRRTLASGLATGSGPLSDNQFIGSSARRLSPGNPMPELPLSARRGAFSDPLDRRRTYDDPEKDARARELPMYRAREEERSLHSSRRNSRSSVRTPDDPNPNMSDHFADMTPRQQAALSFLDSRPSGPPGYTEATRPKIHAGPTIRVPPMHSHITYRDPPRVPRVTNPPASMSRQTGKGCKMSK